MTEQNYGKGNLLLSYLFNTDDVISNLDSEATMKKELQKISRTMEKAWTN